MTEQKICNLIASKIKRSDNLLDVGCGEGYLCNCLAQKLQKPVVGLDISNKGFNKAHTLCKKFKTCNLIECWQGKAEYLGKIARKKKFDVITFVHSFHHTGNTRRALEQSKKNLREGARIIIVEFSPERGKKEDDCRRFTIGFIVGLLFKNAFRDIHLEQPEDGLLFIVAKL